MRIVDRGTVFTTTPGTDTQSAAFPSPCVTPGGRWLCAFRVAPTKAGTKGQRTFLTWSDDEGRSWSEPIEPFPPTAVDGKPGLIRGAALTALGERRLIAALCWVDHSDPEAPFFNEATEGLLDTRMLLAESDDGGEAWSPPRLMDTSPFHVPTPITGPILRLPQGELACQFEVNKPYDDPEPWRHASVLMFSKDGGRTWPRHAVVTQDPANRVFYWDQRPAVIGDGRILDVFWTFDRQAATYRNIHGRESADDGRTWSGLWDTGVPGQPAAVFALANGALAMPYVDRTAAPVIKVRRSSDGGRTWPADGELILHGAGGPSQTEAKASMQDAWSEMSKFSVGLPNTAPLPQGGAVVAYYAGTETDVTSIHWARIE